MTKEKKSLLKNFNNYFTVKKNQHQYKKEKTGCFSLYRNNNYYGSNSITFKAINQWNEVQDSLNIDLHHPEITVPNFVV